MDRTEAIKKLQKSKDKLQTSHQQQINTKYGYNMLLSNYQTIFKEQPYQFVFVICYKENFITQCIIDCSQELKEFLIDNENNLKMLIKNKPIKEMKLILGICQKYDKGTNVTQLQQELTDVKNQVQSNINQMFQNQEILENIDMEADELQQAAVQMRKETQKQRCLCF